MAYPDSRRIQSDGVTLHLRDWGGEGFPTLLLHGMGANTHWWDGVSPRLTGLRAVALDFRGHGESTWARDELGYSLEAFAGDVESARRAMGWDRFFLAGHSLGARVSLAYAAQRPERLAGVAALDFLCEAADRTTARFEKAKTKGQPFYTTHEEVEKRFHLQPRGTLLSDAALRELGKTCIRRTPDGRWTWKFDWRALRMRYEAIWPLLAAVRVPTLLLRAEHSTILPEEHLERLRQGIAGASSGVVQGAHHHLTVDLPEESARRLVAFAAPLASAAAPGGAAAPLLE